MVIKHAEHHNPQQIRAVYSQNDVLEQKPHKDMVIIVPNTIIDPNTMMIKATHAAIAGTAVFRACRLFEFTCSAVGVFEEDEGVKGVFLQLLLYSGRQDNTGVRYRCGDCRGQTTSKGQHMRNMMRRIGVLI